MHYRITTPQRLLAWIGFLALLASVLLCAVSYRFAHAQLLGWLCLVAFIVCIVLASLDWTHHE